MKIVLVYPRLCGGTGGMGCYAGWGRGLSPPVRGNRSRSSRRRTSRRSIPACAGEPTMAAASCRPSTVYPRLCGGTLAVAFAGCNP